MGAPLHTIPKLTMKQQAATSTPTSIDPTGSLITTRILFKAAGAGCFIGWGKDISTTNSAVELATTWMEVWCSNPKEIFIVGASTAHIIFEQPEG